MPTEWQPNLNNWNPDFCSYPDVGNHGWRKWSAVQPDWLAKDSSSCHPDWYNRHLNYIRRADYEAVRYERTRKPSNYKHDHFVATSREARLPKEAAESVPPNGSFYGKAISRFRNNDIQAPKWGQFHPDHYENPYRFQTLPPIQPGETLHDACPILKWE